MDPENMILDSKYSIKRLIVEKLSPSIQGPSIQYLVSSI